jgi:predicted dehydrogenase
MGANALRALIVGLGSIGTRHLQVLQGLGLTVEAVSRHHRSEAPKTYATLAAALEHSFDYVVVANETETHFNTVCELANAEYDGKVLVEKPLFDAVRELPAHRFAEVYVGFNLRFHPLVRKLKGILTGEPALSASFYTGQYLPAWRTNRSYENAYSARSVTGGGVLKDLSHEIDMMCHWFGEVSALAAVGGKYSSLNIATPDVYSLVAACERCPSLAWQVNYLDRLGRRQYIVNTDRHTYGLDLVRGTLQVDGDCEQVSCERDTTYSLMHQQALAGNPENILCDLAGGLYVMKVIEATESANRSSRVVSPI